MTITLSPEQEEIVAEAIRSGAYSSPGQVIGRALESLVTDEQWLVGRRDEIDAKLGRAIAQLDRGEGIPGDVARARLQARKREWLEANGHHA